MGRFFSVAAAVLASGFLPAVVFASSSWQVTQLSFGPYNDAYPEISEGNVIWQRLRETSMGIYPEICLYDGTQTSQLTHNWANDNSRASVAISGSRAAWDTIDSYGISYFDGTTVTRLAAPGGFYRNVSPSISGTTVAWTADDWESTRDVLLYSGGQIKKLTNGGLNGAPSVSGNNVVWSGRPVGESSAQIFLYDGSAVTQLTHGDYWDSDPRVSGSNVAWIGGPSSSETNVFLYNGMDILQLTQGNTHAGGLKIDGGSVVWQASDGHDEEIFLYRDGKITQLTNNNYDDYSPDVSGSYVTWEGHLGDKSEVFVYDGVSTMRLTENGSWARIDGTTVVWSGITTTGSRIFMATLIPEPTTLMFLALGATALLRKTRPAG